MQTDIHQHIWTTPLLDALAARTMHPFVERTREGLTVLHAAGEPPRMVETMARWVGPSQLVYGSHRPVVDPVATGRETELMAAAGTLPSPRPVLAGRGAA